MEIANAPEVPCVIYQRAIEPSLLSKRDQITKWPKRIIDWKEALNGASDHDCVDVEANDPLYILHTSGTTGKYLEYLHSALIRYKQWLSIKQRYPSEFYSPTYDIDVVWHAHQ